MSVNLDEIKRVIKNYANKRIVECHHDRDLLNQAIIVRTDNLRCELESEEKRAHFMLNVCSNAKQYTDISCQYRNFGFETIASLNSWVLGLFLAEDKLDQLASYAKKGDADDR